MAPRPNCFLKKNLIHRVLPRARNSRNSVRKKWFSTCEEVPKSKISPTTSTIFTIIFLLFPFLLLTLLLLKIIIVIINLFCKYYYIMMMIFTLLFVVVYNNKKSIDELPRAELFLTRFFFIFRLLISNVKVRSKTSFLLAQNNVVLSNFKQLASFCSRFNRHWSTDLVY